MLVRASAGLEPHFIDYDECSGDGLAHYAKVLQDRGYVYATHGTLHDIEARELEDGIEAVRNLLPRC